VLAFVPVYLASLVAASLRVAWDVVTPREYMKPAVLAVPLRTRTAAELTTVANLISLTPGTLVLDVSPDLRQLYVHCMFVEDDGAEAREEMARLETRVLTVMRGPSEAAPREDRT
jgi:multicomponent Na+:H+ antiporter subunit E